MAGLNRQIEIGDLRVLAEMMERQRENAFRALPPAWTPDIDVLGS